MQAKFSATGAISTAINLTKGNWYVISLFVLVIYLLQQTVSGLFGPSSTQLLELMQSKEDPDAVLAFYIAMWPKLMVGSILGSLVAYALSAGVCRMYLDVIDGRQPDVSAFKMPANTYVHYVLCNIVVGLLTGFATLFCIVPGLFVAVRLMLAPYYVIDRGMSCTEAVKASWRETEGNWWHLFGTMIVTSLFALAGLLLCCVGALYTGPMAALALVIVYRDITRGQQPVPAEPVQTEQPETDNYQK